MTRKTESNQILSRMEKEEILSLAQKIWQNQSKVATEIASEALTIISEKYQTDPTFFSGKSAKGILSGLFYLLGHRHDSTRTQREIAVSLNTTEVTLRASCREWAKPLQNHFGNRKTK